MYIQWPIVWLRLINKVIHAWKNNLTWLLAINLQVKIMVAFRLTMYLQLWDRHQSNYPWHVHCLPNWLWLLCRESPPSTGVSWLRWETSCRVREARRELCGLSEPRKPSFTASLPKRISVKSQGRPRLENREETQKQNISWDTRIWLFWVPAPSVLEQGLSVS